MFKDVDIKFVNKEITPFGGLSLFFKMLEKCGYDKVLQECGLPEQGSNRGYKPWQLVMGLFAGVWCGKGIRKVRQMATIPGVRAATRTIR